MKKVIKKSIWYLFKENFLNVFKYKIQLFSLLVLNLILTIVLVVSWTTINRIDESINYMNANNLHVDTSYFFETRSKPRDSSIRFNPIYALHANSNSLNRSSYWSSTDDEPKSKNKYIWKKNYESWQIASTNNSNDGSLLPFTIENIDIIINKNNRVEIKFAPGWLNWKRINKDNTNFKLSLIGQLLEHKFNGEDQDINFQKIYYSYQIELEKYYDNYFKTLLTAIYYSNYFEIFKDIINSNDIKKEIIKKINPTVNTPPYWLQNFNDDDDIFNPNTPIKGEILEDETVNNSIGQYTTKKNFISFYQKIKGKKISVEEIEELYEQKNIFKQGLKGDLLISTYYIRNSSDKLGEEFEIPEVSNNNFKELIKKNTKFIKLLQIYNQMLGLLNNFHSYNRMEYLFTNSNTNITYRIINSEIFNDEKTNELKIIQGKKPEAFNQIAINPHFAKQYGYKVGDKIKISDLELIITGIGGDAWTILPTVNQLGFIPNPAKEAIIYTNENLYYSEHLSRRIDIEEKSQAYFQYYGKNNELDKTSLSIWLSNFYPNDNTTENIKKWNKIKNDINEIKKLATEIKTMKMTSNEENNFTNRGIETLNTIRKSYILITMTITIFITFITILVIILMIKKIIERQSVSIGILKTLGYTNLNIILSFSVYPLIITLITAPLGWIIGLVLQLPIMEIFNNLFTIQYNVFIFNFWGLLISFLLIIVITTLSSYYSIYRQINKNPLLLLNPQREIKSPKWIKKIYPKIAVIPFKSRLKLILISVSFKKMIMMLLTIFLSTFTISISLLIPATVNTLERSYYTNIKNKSELEYSSPIANNPLSRYSVTDWKGINDKTNNNPDYPISQNKPIADYFFQNNEWKKLTDHKNEIKTNDVLQQLAENFYWTGGRAISLGWIENFSQQFKGTTANNVLTSIVCTILGSLVGGAADNSSDWKTCVQNTISSNLPIYIKETLKDPIKKNRFAFSYNSLAYNSNEDEFFTQYNSNFTNEKNNDKSYDIKTYGIKNNSEMILFSKNIQNQLKEPIFDQQNNKHYPIVVNQPANLRYGLYINQTINSQVENQLLNYLDKNGVWNPIPKDWWSYEDDSNKDIWTMEMNKWTLSKDKQYGYTDIYNEKQEIKEYNNLNRIILKIPKNKIDKDWEKELINDNNLQIYTQLKNKYIVEESDNDWKIRPFVPYKLLDNTLIDKTFYDSPLNIFMTDSKKPITYFGKYFYHNEKFAYKKEIKKIKYKVIDIHHSYEQPKIYIDQHFANEINNFKESNFKEHYKYNNPFNDELIWFNGRYSKNPEVQDLTARTCLTNSNRLYDLGSLANNSETVGNCLTNVDLLSVKQELIKKLIAITSSIAAIFIILAILLAVIIIIMITNFLIQQFTRVMALMKIQGYKNSEINNLILSVFILPVILGFIIGFILSWLSVKLVLYLISQFLAIIIPLWFTWWVLAIVFVLVFGIYCVTYWISNHHLKKMNILELVKTNDE